jgi:hypothetical protein
MTVNPNYKDHFHIVAQDALRLNLQYFVQIVDWRSTCNAEVEDIEFGIALGQHLQAQGKQIGFETIEALKKKVDNLGLAISNNAILKSRLEDQIHEVTTQLEIFWHEMQADLTNGKLSNSEFKEYLIHMWKIIETGKRINFYQSDTFSQIATTIEQNRPLA